MQTSLDYNQLERTKDNSYNNSIHETDSSILNERESKARKQEEKILKLFEDHPHADFTAYDVYLRMGAQWPKSSVQRALTNLCQKREAIAMTGNKRKGEYDVETNTWKLKLKP
jgi:predicted AlkP superfamily pyrophosphatase or phosphodiesterase